MANVNIDQARYNMIEQQIRPWDVLDPQVLEIIATTPRERFVPKEYKSLAFTDTTIPLLHGQHMLEPKLEGRILQTLQIKPTDHVLEIGTGSGYLTACLARLAGSVLSVDIYPEFIQHAQQQLAGLGIENVEFREGDAAQGWYMNGQFDVIVITGSLPVFQEKFLDQLNIGGRLFVVVGDEHNMEALLVKRISEQEFSYESLFETHIDPLINALKPQAFKF